MKVSYGLVYSNSQCDVLELDQLPRALVKFPLLTSGYFPDTEDLTADGPARDYWLTCFEEALDRVGSTNLLSTYQFK